MTFGGLESLGSSPDKVIAWAILNFSTVIQRYRAKTVGAFAFCVDTFEEAQLLGEPVVGPVLQMLSSLAASSVIRVIICGRAALPEGGLLTPNPQLDPSASMRLKLLPLTDLKPSDAVILLEHFMRRKSQTPSSIRPPCNAWSKFSAAIRCRSNWQAT